METITWEMQGNKRCKMRCRARVDSSCICRWCEHCEHVWTAVLCSVMVFPNLEAFGFSVFNRL